MLERLKAQAHRHHGHEQVPIEADEEGAALPLRPRSKTASKTGKPQRKHQHKRSARTASKELPSSAKSSEHDLEAGYGDCSSEQVLSRAALCLAICALCLLGSTALLYWYNVSRLHPQQPQPQTAVSVGLESLHAANMLPPSSHLNSARSDTTIMDPVPPSPPPLSPPSSPSPPPPLSPSPPTKPPPQPSLPPSLPSPSPAPPPLPRPPFPPPSNGHMIVAELNARFRDATASNDIQTAGVLIRSWDALSAWGRPWLPCTKDEFCARYSDRFAVSLIYPGHNSVYDKGGFVLRPGEIELNCAYASDGGSQGACCSPPGKTATCSPGCKRWCDPARGAKNWGCAWKPEQLREMILQQQVLQPAGGQYNEVILDSATWVQNLPHTIMAVYVFKGAEPSDVDNSRRVHMDFLRYYGITSEETPFVTFDLENPSEPFELAKGVL